MYLGKMRNFGHGFIVGFLIDIRASGLPQNELVGEGGAQPGRERRRAQAYPSVLQTAA
jgi:hypothetical protein